MLAAFAFASAAFLLVPPSGSALPAWPSRVSLPRMAEAKDVATILSELDEATAAVSAAKAEQLKTEQERIAAQKAAEAAAASEGRVTVFGARLDDDLAGQEEKRKRKAREEHEILFDKGIALMRKGEYKLAVTAFTQATAAAPGGLTARRGGQYAIYLAEALQAAGRKKEAVGLLRRCESHPDADVRKIADNVLYIMQAPELKIDSDFFVTIPSIEESDDWGTRRRAVEDKDPPPEKYSIEWYLLEAEKNRNRKEVEAADPTPALAAVGALMLATAALLVLRQPP